MILGFVCFIDVTPTYCDPNVSSLPIVVEIGKVTAEAGLGSTRGKTIHFAVPL